MKVTILGCGTSTGVPRIGDDWGDCDPEEPRNRRTRSSIVVEHEGFRILVDTGPDLRHQLLATGIGDLDAVIWTHDHADHAHGLDDLRQIYFQRREPIPTYANGSTLRSLTQRFAYVFSGNAGYPATAKAIVLEDAARIGPFLIRCTEQPHGPGTSTGLRFEAGGKAVGYAIDFHQVTDTMARLYSSLDLLVCDCLRRRSHPTHANLEMALGLVASTGAKMSLLTHMDKSMDYRTLQRELPERVAPAHDGQEIVI